MSKLILLIGMIPLAAFAGKEERDLFKTEVTPAVTEAQKTYKSSCGCGLTINLDAKIQNSKDDLRSAKHFSEMLTENVKTYCTDKESKAAFCKMKSVSITHGNPAFALKGSTATVMIDGSTYPSWDVIKGELDK